MNTPTKSKPRSLALPATPTGLGAARERLFNAARAGLLQLPKPSVDAWRAASQAEAVALPDYETVEAARRSYRIEVTGALRKGDPFPSPEGILSAQEAERVHAEQGRARDAAIAALRAEMVDTLGSDDEVIISTVRPAIAALEDQARSLLDKHRSSVLTADAETVVKDEPNAATAWTRFGEVVDGWMALRDIHQRLSSNAQDDGRFAVLWNDPREDVLWGASRWHGKNMLGDWVPWPREPRAYLAWLVTSGVRLWVPTAEERNQRWLAVFPPGGPAFKISGPERQIYSETERGSARAVVWGGSPR